MGKGKIVSVISYRGGTGKSNLSANLAACFLKKHFKVAVLDTDLKSPGVHVLFNLPQSRIKMTLVDFLWNRCPIEDTAYDVTCNISKNTNGKCWLVPASLSSNAISRLIDEGYDINLLNTHFDELISFFDLDYLIIDTHPGINQESMMASAISDILLLLIRPDKQDYFGSALLSELMTKLEVPNTYLVANKVVSLIDRQDLKNQLKNTFGYDVIGVIPLNEDFAQLGSQDIFVLEKPDHELSFIFCEIAEKIVSVK